MKGILGKKVGMTQLFDENGIVVPVTVIEAGPCYVTQIKNIESDGYNAIQIGFDEVAERKLTKGEKGHLKVSGSPVLRHLRELRSDSSPEFSLGDILKADIFSEGEMVDVTATSKGKGFAGAVKRHNFAGGPKTHGQSDRHRAPGSNGSGTTPGRVYKGARRHGHMGDDRVTVQSLKVVLVDAERNLIGVHGAVPGSKGGLVIINEARKQ